VNKFLKL